MRRRLPTVAAIAMAAALTAGCQASLRTPSPSVAPPAPAEVPQTPPPEPPVALPDPVVALLAEAERHFEAGQQELSRGHLDSARSEFDRSLAVLLESPLGARTDPRLRERFDQLVDRISAYETIALREGDGFTEKKYEAASLDDLLGLSLYPHAAPSADLRDIVATDLSRTTHDISIPLNDRVLTYIDLFQGRLRDWFQAALTRGAAYLPMIQGVLRAQNLPLDLAYVPIVESAFSPTALSRAKAKGTWQFIRSTAQAYGLKYDWYVDERSNPEKATVAAAKYLSALRTMFKGNWHLALASYNGGPGLVQRAMTRTKITDFWKLIDKPRALPRETREYVPMVLAAIVIARNPAQYGFEVADAAPREFDTVMLAHPVDLRRIAEWAGTTIDEIEALNPELRRWTTPVGAPSYALKVPTGTAPALEARLSEAEPSELATLNWYVVKKGDSLAAIAKKLRVSRSDLSEANRLTLRSRVTPGQRLIIPVVPAAVVSARAQAGGAAGAPPVADAAGPADGGTAPPADAVKVVYRVKSGDTLYAIARMYRTTVDALKTWNHLDSSRILPGDRLTIYTKGSGRPEP